MYIYINFNFYSLLQNDFGLSIIIDQSFSLSGPVVPKLYFGVDPIY